MNVTVFFHLLWLLCGLGSVVFAAEARSWRDQALLLLGLIGGVAYVWNRPLPDPAAVGVVAAVCAGYALIRPPVRRLLPIAGGVLAGLAVGALRSMEVAAPVACLGALPALVSMVLATRRRRFAPEPIREEALLFIVALASVTALAPGIAAGWQSATSLNLEQNKDTVPLVPTWVMWTAGLSAMGGGLFAALRRTGGNTAGNNWRRG